MSTSALRRPHGKPPPPPPISELSELSAYADEHLVHEVSMLWLAASQDPPSSETPPATRDFARNAQAETFALHLRNLIAFLYPDWFEPKRDDVCAHHFLDTPAPYQDWLRHRPGLSTVLENAKRRADKELAHLTTARIAGTPQEKHWDVLSLLREIDQVLAVLAQRADPKRLGSEAQAAITGLSECVKRLVP